MAIVDFPQPDSPARPNTSPFADRECHLVDRATGARLGDVLDAEVSISSKGLPGVCSVLCDSGVWRLPTDAALRGIRRGVLADGEAGAVAGW